MYTLHENDIVEEKISNDMKIISEYIVSSVENVKAIFLTGGFGRGEGSVIVENNRCQPLNDYDLVVIADSLPKEKLINSMRLTLAELCGIRQVDLSLMRSESLPNLNFTMSNYDLATSSKAIYGSVDILKRIPRWSPKKLPLVEGVVPLFLFLSSIIQAYPKQQDLTQNQLFWSYQQLTKSILGWSTAMLIFKGLYDPSYYKRNEIFQKHFAKDKDLCDLVRLATNFKLYPTLKPCDETQLTKLWEVVKESHLRTLKLLLPEFYNFQFKTWDHLISRHKRSMANITKAVLSIILRRHYYYDCLNTDLAKLYLCLSIGNDNPDFLSESKQCFKRISSIKNKQKISDDLNLYLDQLVKVDINSQIFSERGDDIFYE